MSNFARGPWRLDGHHVHCDGEFTLYVRNTRFDSKHTPHDTARLIAAAPDLLAALHDMLEDGDETDRTRALNAIIKAERGVGA